MSKEYWYSLAFVFISFAMGAFQLVYPLIPPIIGWPIISGCAIAAIYCYYKGRTTKANENTLAREHLYSEVWAHYDKLTNLILSMENAPTMNWSTIVAGMQRELNGIGDNEMNTIMKLFFDVVDEDEHFGMGVSRQEINRALQLTRERMNRRFRR